MITRTVREAMLISKTPGTIGHQKTLSQALLRE
jgi:hypothetical protein